MTQQTGGQDRGVGWDGRPSCRLAGLVAGGSVSGSARGRDLVRSDDPVARPRRPTYSSVTLAVLALAFSVVGAIIASRQPRNAIGWLFCGVGVTIGLSSFAGELRRVLARGRIRDGRPRRDGGVVLVVVVDPSGIRPHDLLAAVVPRRPATLAALAARGLVRCARAYRLPRGLSRWSRDHSKNSHGSTNPYGVDSPLLEAVAIAGAILASASMVASAVSLIVRMRRAGRTERQQIKWLAYGGALVVGAVFVGGVIAVWSGDVGIALVSLGLLGVPISTGVAIARLPPLRHRRHHQPHPRLRCSDGDAGPGLPRGRGRACRTPSGAHRPGVHPGRRRLDPR